MRRRQRTADEELDITPMIDVTFLLLIFFMVASTMQRQADQPLPPAVTGEAVAERTATVLTLSADGEAVVIRLGDGPDAPDGTRDDVAEYVTDGIAGGRPNVIIKADRDLPSGFVEDVARAANVPGLGRLYYGVDEPRN